MDDASLAYLRDRDVSFVQVVWVDNANVIRSKMPLVDQLERSGGVVGISMAQQALPVMYDAVVPESGLGPVGEALLRPDWRTLRALPYLPGFARVLADATVGEEPWEHCPRTFLKRQVARLAAHGLELKASFENEFFLLAEDEAGRIRPVDDTVFAATAAVLRSGPVILDIARALIDQGIDVETYYPESGPGQHELSTRFTDALAAADSQVVFRDTVHGVAARHGLVASFLPKVFEDKAGSGCHLNLSLWREGRNVTGDASSATGLSALAGSFIAGIVAHLPALCALTVPTNSSYRRIRPHFWAGAFAAWGIDNREAAVRVFGARSVPQRFELKTSDATANPYLALGGVIAAGLDGIERGLELPPECRTDPGRLSEAEREAAVIVRLPSTLGQAIEALERDEVLMSALGEARARAYVAVRRAEWEALREMPFEDEVALLLRRY